MANKRIQRQRTKGWKMPPNTVYVGRGSRWGNPYKVEGSRTAEQAVELFSRMVNKMHPIELYNWLLPIAGYNLACWCKEGEACHADVLLEKCEQLQREWDKVIGA